MQEDVKIEIVMQFDQFNQIYKPVYKNKEEVKYRLQVFAENQVKIKMLGSNDKFGVGKFSDRTKEEFQSMKGFVTSVKPFTTKIDFFSKEKTDHLVCYNSWEYFYLIDVS